MTYPYRTSMLIALFIVSGFSSARAQVDINTTLFYGSPYVWRGQILSTGFVFQPTISASYQNFSLIFFGNIDPDAAGDRVRFNEADLTAAYGFNVGNLALGAGYTYYTFPTPADGELELNPTQEVYASAALTDVPLSPSLLVVYDFDAMEGIYAQAGIGHAVPVSGQPINLGATLGFDSNYLFEDQTGVSFLAFTVGSSFETGGGLTISPLVGLQFTLDDVYEGQAEGYGYDGSVFYGGIGISF